MITVLGLPRHFHDADLTALSRADLVAGAPRHLQATRHMLTPRASEVVIDADLDAVLSRVAAAGHPIVLASGDPGHYGIVRALVSRFGSDELDVRPAVSAVGAAFAAVGLPWDDARVVTAHGVAPDPVIAICRRFPKVAVLTAPRLGPAGIAHSLTGFDRQVVVVEDVDGPRSRVTRGTPEEIAATEWSDPNVVLVIDPAQALGGRSVLAPARVTPTAWALEETAFDDHDGTITGAEARAVLLAWLGPGPGDLVWDVGAGSGAVAVEAARLGAAAIAIERAARRCERVRANAARHSVPIEIVHGDAPAVLSGLPDPDAVFVGGGGTNVVLAAAERARRVVVTTLTAVERVGPVRRALVDDGWDVDATMLSAARLTARPTGHRLDAQDPIFLVRGRRT